MKNKFYSFLICIFFLIYLLLPSKIEAQLSDTLKKKQLFELSFGQSLLFISNSKLINARSKEALIIPTNAILFFAELRVQKKIKVPLFFNIATEPKQFLVNNQLIAERASPTFGAGLEYKIFEAKIDPKFKLDFEAGLLISCLFTNRNAVRLAPVLAARLRLLSGDNFVMYVGTSYSFFIDSWGLLYGTGTVY